ncbi:MAG: hypothetical protein K8I60_13300 [Anaerolineae bacterium]|nr:hypothetical protein [Anaerolineae bacterium]
MVGIMSRRVDWSLSLLLFITALLLRLYFVAASGFDGLYGQDAYAYYDFTGNLLKSFQTGQPLPVFFWPLGYPTLLVAGFTLFGASAAVGQAISIIMGAGLAPLVFILARQIQSETAVLTIFSGRPRRADPTDQKNFAGTGQSARPKMPGGAFTAGLLVAVCGQAVQSSLVLMADIPALFWGLLSSVLLLAYLSRQSPPRNKSRWLMGAVVCLMLACITRWLYLALIPVWGAALLFTHRDITQQPTTPSNRLMAGAHGGAPLQTEDLPISKIDGHKKSNGLLTRRDMLLAGTAGLLILVPQLIFSATSPYPTFNHAWVQGWSPVNAFQREFTNIDGHFLYEKLNAVFYAQPFYDAYYLSPLFTPLIVIGLWAVLRRKPFSSAVMLSGWMLLPYVFLAGIPYQNIRFPLIVVPAVAVLAGIGLENAVHWLAARLPHRTPVLIGAALLVGLGVGQMLHTAYPVVTTFITNQQADKAVVQWAAERIPAGATVYTFGLTLTLRHYSSFEVYEVYSETPETLAQKWQHGQVDYLLIDPWNINNQWAGREPQIAIQWLENERGLRQIGRYSHYILYRISG